MRSNTTAVIGLVVGLIGAILLGLFVARSTDGDVPADAVTVLVAATDITANTPATSLTAAQVETRDVPGDLRPVTAVDDVAALEGQLAVRTIGRGEILSTTMFAAAGPVAGGVIVEEGYEAISVQADRAPGVEGYVTPGDKVNVYATVIQQAAGELASPFTQLVLGHVRVLAVTPGASDGQAAQVTEGAPTRLTMLLEVRPEDAPVLVFAEQQGSLWYSLVNGDDPAPAVARVQLQDLDPATRQAAIAEAIRLQDAREAATGAETAAGEAPDATEEAQ